MIHQKIYTSTATGDPSADLPAILTCARRNNPELDLTGLLVVNGSTFVQLLEGDIAYMEPLFELLRTDNRHRDLRVLVERDTALRAFPDWSMAHADLDESQQGVLSDLLARVDRDPASTARNDLVGMMTALAHLHRAA